MNRPESKHRLARKYTCPVCKKPFYITVDVPEWGYKIKKSNSDRAVCSYKCMRDFEIPRLEKQRLKMQKEFQKAWDDEVKIWDAMGL